MNKKIVLYTFMHSLIISLLLVFLLGSLLYLLINIIPVGVGVWRYVKDV